MIPPTCGSCDFFLDLRHVYQGSHSSKALGIMYHTYSQQWMSSASPGILIQVCGKQGHITVADSSKHRGTSIHCAPSPPSNARPSMTNQPFYTQPRLGAHRSLMKIQPSANSKAAILASQVPISKAFRFACYCYPSPFINAAASTSPQPKACKDILNPKACKHTTPEARVKGRQHHKAGTRTSRQTSNTDHHHHQAKRHTKQPEVIRTQCISIPAAQRPSIHH